MRQNLTGESTKGTLTPSPILSNMLQALLWQSRRKKELRALILDLELEGEIIGLDLSCTDFENCVVSNVTFSGCDLRGATFRNSRFGKVQFVDCMICDTVFPATHESVSFHNCSELPSGSATKNSAPDKEIPTKPFGDVTPLIEVTARVTKGLSIDKILGIAIILAFITIMFIVYKGIAAS